MRFPSARYWIFLLFATVTLTRTEAQSSLTESSSADSAYSVALRQYHRYVAPEVGLYRGLQYIDYDYTVQKGQPFLGPDLIRIGSVWYGGMGYSHIPMEYDLVKEQLVIMDPFNVFKISLYMDMVDSFALDGHLYFKMKDSLAPSSMRSGFWDRLYQGRRLVVLKRERKIRNENIVISSDNIRFFIDSSVSYYVKKDNSYHPLNNKQELFDALKDRRRSEIRRVIRRSGLRWHDDKEEVLRRVAAWYDGIKH